MNKDTKEILQQQSAKYIAELFINHNINCAISENKIGFKKEQISIETYCFDRNSSEELIILQLDVYIIYGINPILESFAGVGKDFEAAIIDALENFKSNSFHTILSAFFTSEFDIEINKYNWNISGKDFEVFSSNIGIRGKQILNLSTKWLNQFEEEVKRLELNEGTHWIRLFFAQQQNQITCCEVLLNNEYCTLVQQKAEKFEWYKQDEFYSIRIFMILKNGIDFERIVKIVGSDEEYEDTFSILEKMGLSELEIEKAFAFIPEAFGRKLNQDIGIAGTYSNKAGIMNIDKEKFEINLDNEKMYSKATVLINELTKNGWNNDLKQIAFTSASFNTLNTALNEGAKLEEIDCSNFSAIFYIPTYSEMTTNKQKKPIWKIW
jgi:hypothetical protein